MLYVVTHDCRTRTDQQRAGEYVRSIARTCWTHVEGLWFIDSDRPGVEIRKGLSTMLEPGARIVVAMLAGFAAWQGFDDETEVWLASHL
jgi:hypothetical protein